MIEEHFAHGDSFLHRRDPRGKIIAAICYTTTIALLHSFTAVSVALAFSLALLLSARLSPSKVCKRMLMVNGFTLFLWFTLPLTYGGEHFHKLGFLALSHDGILLAAMITGKTNAIILAIMALITTTSVADIGSGLDRLRFPKKICFLLLYSYRYIFVIYQEYTRLLRAARMRSFSPGTNLHTYKTFAYLFGMTLVKSYNRSQRVHQAMILRGFNGRLISLHRYRFTSADVLFVVLILAVNVSIMYLGFAYR